MEEMSDLVTAHWFIENRQFGGDDYDIKDVMANYQDYDGEVKIDLEN